MGDVYFNLVPKGVKKEEVQSLADKVLNMLLEKKIISPELKDNVLGNNFGYPPGKNWFLGTENQDYDDFLTLMTNGFDVIKKRSVYGGFDIDEINCPGCGHNNIQCNWSDLIGEWFNNTSKDMLPCEHCGNTISVIEYQFEPTWAFGELGFVFWNWPPLSDNFIEELEQLIERKIEVVVGKL